MALCLYANNAQTTLAGGISSAALSANLASGTGALFPSPTGGAYFAMTFQDAATKLVREIVSVTARSGDTVTIVRAQEGTTATAFITGDTAGNWWTAGSAAALVQTTALQTQAGNYAVDTGSVNNIVAALTPAPTSLSAIVGSPIRVKVLNTNTGNATLTLTPLAATQIINPDGTVMSPSQLPAGGVVTFIYDGARYYLQSAPYEIRATNNVFTGINEFVQTSTFDTGVTAYLMPNGGQFRAVAGNVGVMLHNDGTNAYLLQTPGGTPLGIYNGYRPFFWNLNTGAVTIDGTNASTTFNGNVVMNSGLTTVGQISANGNLFTNNSLIATSVSTSNFQDFGSAQIDGSLNVNNTISTLLQNVSSTLTVNGSGNFNAGVNVAGIVTSSYSRMGAGAINSGDPNRVLMLGDFNQASFAGNGYILIPSFPFNLYVQWGTISTPAGNNVIVTYNFPVAFPHACMSMVISYGSSINPPAGSIGADPISSSQFTARDSSTSGTHGCHWFAVGY